ncbi:hypothetical protein IWW37_004124, partial [Coemansia sp. RSA 2050]
MSMLGLNKKYLTYKSNTSSKFDQFAKDMPAVGSVVAAGGRQERKAEFLEKHYIKGF